MQLKQSDVVNKVALKHDLDSELLQSISNSVFKDVAYKLKNPTNLIIYIKGLGKIYARRKKAKDGILKINHILNSPKPYLNVESYTKYKESLMFLLDKYEDFDKLKNKFKTNKNDNNNDTSS